MSKTRPVHRRPSETPFDTRDGRVMLSLGPLTSSKHCTYSCPFCYVGGEFLSYASLDIEQIVRWLKQVDDPYDVIYVSCDTDSFAPPRQEEAMDLLDSLVDFGVDILFTTRALFSQSSMSRLASLSGRLRQNNLELFGCTSLCQLSVPHLEPPPIPSPQLRIEQISEMREIGVRTILALRPFLPNVPDSDYEDLVDLAASSAEAVLGGVWYYDQGGSLEGAVFADQRHASFPHTIGPMPFDTNTADWLVYSGSHTEAIVRAAAERNCLPMFMRSGPALTWLRAHQPPTIGQTS